MIARLRKLDIHMNLKKVCLVLLGVAIASPSAIAQAPPESETPAGLFKTNCALCHGDDGSGTELGKRFHVKDLRTKEVQDKTSEALARIIRTGKDNMPAFGKRLSDDQIQKLVEHIRHFTPASS